MSIGSPDPIEEVESSVERATNFENQDNGVELTDKERKYYWDLCLDIVSENEWSDLIEGDFKKTFEQKMLKWVKNLPEEISENLWVDGVDKINECASEIVMKIKEESNLEKIADLQIQLIFQYIALTSRVQNWWMHWVLPWICREINWLDCSISTWCLKEKLEASGIDNIDFSFWCPSWHVVWVIKLADERQLYVDAQNWFINEVELNQVYDEDHLDTAYPIYEIVNSKLLSGNIPTIWSTSMARKEGSNYLPQYLWIDKSWVSLTIWNFHMMALEPDEDMKTYSTNIASKFRHKLHNDITQWKKFEEFVSQETWWKVIQETKFEQLSYDHHSNYRRLMLLEKLNAPSESDKEISTQEYIERDILEKECIESAKNWMLISPVQSIENMIKIDFKDFENEFWNELVNIQENEVYRNLIKNWIRLWHNEKRVYNWEDHWWHNGEDYMVEEWTPINSIGDGKIIEVVIATEEKPNPGYWNTMVIEYKLPSWKYIYARYAHLGKIDWFSPWTFVKKWANIGFVWKEWAENGGRPTHLHFQIMTKHWFKSYSDNQEENEYAIENIDPWKVFV